MSGIAIIIGSSGPIVYFTKKSIYYKLTRDIPKREKIIQVLSGLKNPVSISSGVIRVNDDILVQRLKSNGSYVCLTFNKLSYYVVLVNGGESISIAGYDLVNKILEGNAVDIPDEIYPITGLSLCFNTFLTEQYKENNNNQLYIDYTEHLCNDLRTLFYYKIHRNTWLHPSTKKAALKKLLKLNKKKLKLK
jgi:hypothetical protein